MSEDSEQVDNIFGRDLEALYEMGLRYFSAWGNMCAHGGKAREYLAKVMWSKCVYE
jgi:hypothetical protein